MEITLAFHPLQSEASSSSMQAKVSQAKSKKALLSKNA